MSHPNPSHDPENVYPSDNYSPMGKPKKSKHERKYEHRKTAVGKYVGAASKLTNLEYGHKKAKQIALSRKMK